VCGNLPGAILVSLFGPNFKTDLKQTKSLSKGHLFYFRFEFWGFFGPIFGAALVRTDLPRAILVSLFGPNFKTDLKQTRSLSKGHLFYFRFKFRCAFGPVFGAAFVCGDLPRAILVSCFEPRFKMDLKQTSQVSFQGPFVLFSF